MQSDVRGFMRRLREEIALHMTRAERLGLKPCVRLNGTSDIDWENLRGADGLTLFEFFRGVQFYDYTKRPERMWQWLRGYMPRNYYLVFSRSEVATELTWVRKGGNVVVVFAVGRGKALPATWNGWKVIDGDEDDLRFLDKPGKVVGVRAKGRAKRDRSGFVVGVE